MNLKGVTCFEKLQRQLNIFIRAARGMPPNDSMTDELPVSTKIGPFDPSTVSHPTLSETIVGIDSNTPTVEALEPPIPLYKIIGLVSDDDEEENDRLGNDGSSAKLIESETSSMSSSCELQKFCIDNDGFFGNIIIDGTISKTKEVCVYRGQSRNSSGDREKYALKVFLQDGLEPSKLHDVIWDAKLGMVLEHRNICRFIDTLHTPT